MEHKGYRVHQLVFVDILHIYAADGDTAALRVKEARNQRRQRGFAATGGADKRRRLPCADGEGDILQRIFGTVIAEGNMVQRHGAVLGMLRSVGLRKRRALQHTVNAGDGVLHDHAVLTHKHQLGKGQGDDRRDDDVKEQIQQNAVVCPAVGKQEAARDQNTNTLLTASV